MQIDFISHWTDFCLGTENVLLVDLIYDLCAQYLFRYNVVNHRDKKCSQKWWNERKDKIICDNWDTILQKSVAMFAILYIRHTTTWCMLLTMIEFFWCFRNHSFAIVDAETTLWLTHDLITHFIYILYLHRNICTIIEFIRGISVWNEVKVTRKGAV